MHLLKIWQRSQPKMDDKMIVRPWLKLAQKKANEPVRPGRFLCDSCLLCEATTVCLFV